MENNTPITRNANTELAGFFGTEKYYKHFTGFVYTDGVQYAAEHFECYWLLDKILTYCKYVSLQSVPCQVWELARVYNWNDETKMLDRTNAFILSCSDTAGHIVYKDNIPFSDFGYDFFKMYFKEGVLLLPSED